MNTWIAFFRGINVGGHNILPMKSLGELLTKLRCNDVRTYIQSGNVVFKSKETDSERLEALIAGAVAGKYGFKPRILIQDEKALTKAIKENPFSDAVVNHKSLHLWFLASHCLEPNLAGLEALRSPREAYVLKKRVFYLHSPDGIGKSKLAGRVEKLLGVEATARNWQTVTKVRELATMTARGSHST